MGPGRNPDMSSGAATALRTMLSQMELKRVDTKHQESVNAMVREVCDRLLGKTASTVQVPGEAGVWAEAARYLSRRIQGAPAECHGRNPDMSPAAAAALH